jgi:hypothetical protein
MLRRTAVLLSVCAMACGGGGGGGTGGGSGGSSGTGGGSSGTGGNTGTGGGSGTGGSTGTGGGTATGGGSGTGGGTGGGTSGTINVAGKVITSNGVAVNAATVVIIGKGSTTSDAMGNFSFTNVTTPYDIATTAGNGNFITLVRGVTRADPTITSFATGIGTAKSGNVTGNFGGTATPSSFRENHYLFESPETTGNRQFPGTDGGYSVPVSWFGPTTTTGTVHGLQLTRSLTTQLPTSYSAYGSNSNVVLADGNTANMKDISGTGVTAQLLSGSVTVPGAASYLTVSSKQFALRLGKGSITLGTDGTNATTFSFQAPQVANSSISVTATATGMNRTSLFTRYGLAANATNVGITFATPPALSIPASGAMGINLATQSFSWAPMDPTGLYQVVMTGSGKAFVIFTTGTSFVLPSTTELGLGTFATGTSFNWRVTGIGGGPVTPNDIVGPMGASLEAPATGDTWFGQSESRTFQVQ